VLKQAGANPRERELDILFHMLDQGVLGRIYQSELCYYVEGKKQFDFETFVQKERARAKEEGEAAMGRQAWAHGARSGEPDIGSSQVNRDDMIGMPDGMSSILGGSAHGHNKVVPQLMDDEEDQERVYGEVRQLLSTTAGGRPTSLDDLLQLMGKPAARKEDQILLEDFKAVVKGLGGEGRYSAHEIKRVF
jgi:hypothetical protein